MEWWEKYQPVEPASNWWEKYPAAEPKEPLWKRGVKAVGRTAWGGGKMGLSAIAWPFAKAEGLSAGPTTALLETGWKIPTTPENVMLHPLLSLASAFGPDLGAMSGKEGLKHIAKATTAPFRKFSHHPDTRTYSGMLGAYSRRMTGKEPKGFLKGTSVAGGIGASFLATPSLVSQGLKGVTKLGKATPWYKAWQAQQLPKLQDMLLKTKAGLNERITGITKAGQAVTKKKHLKLLAREIFGEKLGKPAQSRKELGRQMKALRERYKAIEMGSISSGASTTISGAPSAGRVMPPLDLISKMKSTGKELKQYGLLGKENIYQKLSRRAKAQMLGIGKRTKETPQGIVQLEKQLEKLQTRKFPGRAKMMRTIQDKIDDLQKQIMESEHIGGVMPTTGEAVPSFYSPRLYRVYEEAAKRRWPFFSKQRIRRPYAKQRKDIPLAKRKELGEITEIGYPEIKRQIQAASDIETAKLFNQIAKQPGWVSSTAIKGFKQLPKGKAYGSLAEKWVHPQVSKDVAGLVDVRTNAGKLLDGFLGTWKGFKVLWSPPTQFRNLGSNAVLNDITGTDYFAQARLAKDALKHFRSNSDEFQAAWKYLGHTGFGKAELADDLLKMSSGKDKGIMWALKLLPRLAKKPAGIYQREEFAGKFIKYLHMKEKGATTLEAVKEANRALFDYGALTAFEKKWMRRIFPFYTFPRKAVPLVLQSMRDNPYAVAKYPLMVELMTKHSLAKLEMSENDFEQIARDLPEYMKRGSYMLLPYRDDNDDIRFFDFTFWMPWGEMSDVTNRGTLDVVLSNPIYTLLADIQRNKSAFTDREIVLETDTFSEKTAKHFAYFWKLMLPSLTPDVIPGDKWSTGGIYWDKLYDAAAGRRRGAISEPEGKIRPLAETVAHTIFGARTQPIDIEETQYYKNKERKRQEAELKSKLNRNEMNKRFGRVSEKEYQRLKKQYLDQIEKIWVDPETELLLKQTR